MTGGPPYSKPTPLALAHSAEAFDSGEQTIDEWLRQRALASHALGFARTFVTTERDRNEILGYYCLSAQAVQKGSVWKRHRGEDPPLYLPAVLLGRLGVHRELQRVGLGTSLVLDAIRRTVEFASNVGVRLMVLDALNESLVGWYARFGFEPSQSDPLRLIAALPSLAATLYEYEQSHGNLG